jgi:hypothetical protein
MRVDEGVYAAYFGYVNEDTIPVNIPVGLRNRFTPRPFDREQPTVFMPGRTPFYPDAAFSIVFEGTALVWHLDGRTVTANANSPACTSDVTP